MLARIPHYNTYSRFKTKVNFLENTVCAIGIWILTIGHISNFESLLKSIEHRGTSKATAQIQIFTFAWFLLR